MSRLFGTDGVRGVANRDLTPDLALALGRAAGRVLAPGGEVVVGRDTRVSGPMLEGALVAGLCSAGVDARVAGIIPTPAVAWLAVEDKAHAGAAISASHNPVADNGIKFFSAEGLKIPSETEDAVESLMSEPTHDLPEGERIGQTESVTDAADRYVSFLAETVDSLAGLRVVLDCAFGAAWSVGPRAFRAAGADIIALHDEPDGTRINVDCGSTSLGKLARAVVDLDADLGIGLDGDADRALAVDEKGRTIDGDHILAMSAIRLQDAGELDNDVVVATVMANLGFRRALEQRGVEVVSAPVGDKFVAQAMADRGAVLGGEQSGHVIFGRHSTTGDGLLTGLKVAEAVATSGASLSELANVFEPYPQVLISVPVDGGNELEEATALWEEVRTAEESLGSDGRVLVRASGTEPVVRVMVEAADETLAAATAESLAAAVSRYLGK
jgi:phosphoglucosamine mutase